MIVVLRVAVWVAACLAFGSAAISLYWTAGGAWLLDTVGGSFERIGRERTAAALLLGGVVVAVKLAAGGFTLALLRPLRRARRLIVSIDAFAATVLCLWGGANVLAGALVLSGTLERSDVDHRALWWHVFVWDAWFLLWGSALAVAVIVTARRGDLGR